MIHQRPAKVTSSLSPTAGFVYSTPFMLTKCSQKFENKGKTGHHRVPNAMKTKGLAIIRLCS